MVVYYKTLCEVKWLHEYYCSTDKDNTVFDLSSPADRLQFLFQQFIKDQPSINRDLDFVIPVAVSRQFDQQLLKIIPSYSGFKLVVRCDKIFLSDGTTVYQPKVQLPNNFQIPVQAILKNNIDAFTNNSLHRPFSAVRYYTNEAIPFAKTFPFLTQPVPAYNAAQVYEQGALASYAANDIRSFLNNGAVNPWLSVSGSNYTNERDKWILPLGFSYTFAAADHITDAQFVLQDANANPIKTIHYSSTQALQTVFLNFETDTRLVRTLPGFPVSSSSIYTLNVTGSNGYTKTFSPLVFCSDSMDVSQTAAYFQLTVQPGNPAFNLLDNNGFLITRIMPDNSKVPPPVFEIWMKSRLLFWQYKNNRQQKIKTTVATQPVLTDNSGVLLLKNPLFLTHSPRLIKKPDNSFMQLPNPIAEDSIQINGNTYLVNIQVPVSSLFPLA